MKKFLLVITGLLLVASSTSTATAADAPAQTPAQIFDSSLPEVGARGILFQENMMAMDSIGYIRYSHIPKFSSTGTIEDSDYWDWKLCNSWEDISCELKSGYTVEGKVYLGYCRDKVEIGCVENLKITLPNGSKSELQYVGPALESIVDTPENRTFNIPRSSTPILFKDSNSNLFLVRAGFFYSITSKDSVSPKMDVDVYPVLKIANPSIKAPQPTVIKSPINGLGIATVLNVRSDCLAITTGFCYKQAATEIDNEISLSLRLPKAITGWFKGRLASPTITVDPYSETSNMLTVTAKSVAMPVMGGWVKFDEIPVNFISNLYPSGGYTTKREQTLGLYADASQGARGFQEFSAWAPYLKDKALTTIDIWSFGTNMNSSKSRCMSSVTSIGGIVTTNASVYSSEPPSWDPNALTLDYKIAAPHFNASGELNVGTYTLAISNEVIKCLYGLGQLPASATVSIVYGDTTTNIGTIAVGSKDGWSYFSANGFHFSTPTVRVKFAKPITPEPEVTTQASPKLPVKKSTITCAKGSAKKKVTAAKPICPKGFKKVSS